MRRGVNGRDTDNTNTFRPIAASLLLRTALMGSTAAEVFGAIDVALTGAATGIATIPPWPLRLRCVKSLFLEVKVSPHTAQVLPGIRLGFSFAFCARTAEVFGAIGVVLTGAAAAAKGACVYKNESKA